MKGLIRKFLEGAGVRPGSRGSFVSAKGPKTILALSWPFGFPVRFAELGGVQTRFAQTMPALFPNSAALLGRAKGHRKHNNAQKIL